MFLFFLSTDSLKFHLTKVNNLKPSQLNQNNIRLFIYFTFRFVVAVNERSAWCFCFCKTETIIQLNWLINGQIINSFSSFSVETCCCSSVDVVSDSGCCDECIHIKDNQQFGFITNTCSVSKCLILNKSQLVCFIVTLVLDYPEFQWWKQIINIFNLYLV